MSWSEIGKALFPPNDNFTKDELIDQLEAINYFDEKDPPLFLWHGGQDSQIPPDTFQAFLQLLNKDRKKNRIVYEPILGDQKWGSMQTVMV